MTKKAKKLIKDTAKSRKSQDKAKTEKLQAKENGKTRILRAAMSAFAKNSFDAVSLPEIAQAAGLGGPSVHYHFGSKENLWRETFDYTFKDLIIRLEAVENAAQDASPEDALKMLCRAFARFTMNYPESIMLLTNENRNPGPRTEWIIEHYLRQFHDLFDNAIKGAVASGAIKPISPIHFIYAMIGSITYFYSVLPLIGSMYGDDAEDPNIVDSYANFLIDMIFNGVSAKNSSEKEDAAI